VNDPPRPDLNVLKMFSERLIEPIDIMMRSTISEKDSCPYMVQRPENEEGVQEQDG
jgi:hypothetical protein